MKKFLFCTTAIAGVVGLVAYMDKNGLPVIGNVTSKIPFFPDTDKPFEWMMTAIDFLESKGIEGI
jgi:hypothetical protein